MSTTDRVRVLIADDHALLREALHRALDGEKDMEVVAEAADGEEAVKLVSELAPDVVVMDIVMPKLSGIEATRKIKEITGNTAILILTAYDDEEYVLGLLDAGAAGYLLKSARGRDVVDAIRTIRAGESVLHPRIIAKLLKRAMGTSVGAHEGPQLLSERESGVLKLVALGMSNKEIADRLCVSQRTVKAHLTNVFNKLNVASRSEAIVKALKWGLVTLEDTAGKLRD
ncbi:MAG: response regulator transcription factor [Dehalococcoidia bacterium]|nr:response regulator transcription factor [Chloroflexota bacterium]MCK4221756.1 response regulator transcription factor [Dehalococcoidia bacterium]